MSLINSTITTAVGVHAISAYVSCNDVYQANKFYLNPNILERLGLGSEGHIVRELNKMEIIAMHLCGSRQDLWLPKAASIKFPEMPRLKYLVLSSDAEWDSTGKATELIELIMPGYFWEKSSGTSIDTLKVLPQVPSTQNDFDAFQCWSSFTECRRYEFLH